MKMKLLIALTALAACSKGNDAKPADTATVPSTAMTPPPPPAPPALTDANILAKLDAANADDSTGGSMASTKGTDAGVKAFGREMMKDHHALRAEGQALAKKLSITPEPVTNDPDDAASRAAADSMTSAPKGAAWDKWYVDHEVADHEKVLAFAQSAANTTTNADIKAAIAKATPVVQKHLDTAKKLQAKLGGSAAPAAGATDAGKKTP